MAGLVFDVGATIAHLKQLLADRYPRAGSELPILKEILQNADDAGASALHLVVLESGLEGVANPLLSGPALVCVNNGRFRLEDEEALRTFGNTSKAGEEAAIGRFGVGQKSVFHLAEAYLYLGRPSATEVVRGDVIDPWAQPSKGDRHFPEWDRFGDADRAVVQEALAPWLTDSSWFLLHLPLRLREHERGAGGVIAKHFPDVNQITADLADLTQLGCLLPQMQGLRSVTTWRVRFHGDEKIRLGQALWRPDGRGLSRPDSGASFEREFRGVVDVHRPGSGPVTIDVFGSERCVQDRALLAVREDPEWPTRATFSPDGLLEDKREKAIPHGATTFLRVRDGRTQLQLSWAAFLPLGNAPEVVRRADLIPGWRVYLHGYFFPDSGRQGVAGGVTTEVRQGPRDGTIDIRVDWNTLLRQRVTLPTLIPALHAAIRASPEDEGERLAMALSLSNVWKACRAHATSACVLAWGPASVEGKAIEGRARIVARDCRLLPIPRTATPKGDLANLLRCMLAVENDGGAALVWNDGPHLGARDGFDAWDAKLARRFLDAVPARLLADTAALEYLAAWVLLACQTGPGTAEQLSTLLRRCFAEAVLNAGLDAGLWRSIAAQCPDDAILFSSAPITLLRSLSQLPTAILLLPEKLRSNIANEHTPRVSLADARTLLCALADRLEGDQTEAVEKLIAELVTILGARTVLEDPALCELRIVRVWSAREGTHTCLRPEDLRARLQQGAAFGTRGVARAADFARKLLAAIPSIGDVVLVDDDSMAEALEVRPFDAQALQQLLCSPHARLGGPAEREALLSWIQGTADGAFALAGLYAAARATPELALALRYLVHAAPEHRDDGALLLVSTRDGELGAAVLGATGQAWRLVPSVIARKLTVDWMQLLEIASLEPGTLSEILESLQPEQCATLGMFLEPEQRAALRVLLARQRAAKLFSVLAIHDTVAERIVAGNTAGIYLRGDWPVPAALRHAVELVARAADPAERALQEETFTAWSAEAQLLLSLEHEDPSQFARELLDAFGAFDVTPEQMQALRDRKWLTSGDGRPAAPGEVLYLAPEVDRSLRLLLEPGARVFLSPGDIAAELREHASFQQVLERVALSGHAAFQAAALQIEECSREGSNPHWILATRSREEERAFLLRGMSVGALASDPSWALVRALHAHYGDDFHEIARDLLNAFRLKPGHDRVTRLLHRFRNERELDANEVEQARAVFDEYLAYAAQRPEFGVAILPRIELLNGNGRWKPTAELAWIDSVNLKPAFQLAERHRAILDRAIGHQRSATAAGDDLPSTSPPGSETGGPEVLADYFAPWTGVISSEPIGYFLACLGSGPGERIARLAELYLQKSKSAEGARAWVFQSLGAEGVGAELSFCGRARWTFQVVADGDEIEVPSLAGRPLLAAVGSGKRSSLFAGRVPRWREDCPQPIRLARVDTGSVPAAELQQLLATSLRSLLLASVGFSLDPGKLDAFWRKFGTGGQAQVAAVRSLILERLPVYIEELIGRRDPVFRPTTEQLEHAEQRFREVRETPGTPEATVAKAMETRDGARAALSALVETKPAAQERLLLAVREKLKTYQYTPEQVLFELFQNADDATRDLEDLHGGEAGPRGFEVTVDDAAATVRIRHWGRPINRGEMTARDPQATDRAFELDLKNMLVLHLSDKDGRSTGRFGLGFKSVHLITRRPHVRSADLSFEVLGGIIPQHVPIAGAPDNSTIITLPLEQPDELAKVVSRFRGCAGMLTAFGRAIRRISYIHAGQRREAGWSPRRIGGIDHLEVGELPNLAPRAVGEPTRALVLRGSDPTAALAIAFRLGARGLEPFLELPDIWYTAPTGESWGLGFCVNSAFELDIGRGRLAYTAPENRQRFAALGGLLGHRLASLATALEERFADTVEVLGLAVGTREPELVRRTFWKSVFDLLTTKAWETRGPEPVDLIRALHGPGAGLSLLATTKRVVPTGLPNDHDVLTCASKVRWIFDETASRPEVLRALLALGTWPSKPEPGTAVSAEVQARLKRVGSAALEHAVEVSFATILEKALANRMLMSVEHARVCQHLVNAVETTFGESSAQTKSLQERLGLALFQPTQGKPRAAKELLIGRDRDKLAEVLDPKRFRELEDEIARAAFAPDEFVLDPSFTSDPDAMKLYLFARQRLIAGDAEAVSGWAMSALEHRRPLVLQYLACGLLGREALAKIKALGGLKWCNSAEQLAPYERELSFEDAQLLRIYLLGHTTTPLVDPLTFGEEDEEPLGDIPIPKDPVSLLRRIAAWWERRGDSWSSIHDHSVYGAVGGVVTLSNGLRAEEREPWITLLSLAACQHFGRQSDEQHSGFVRVLQSKGTPRWWTVVTSAAAAGEEKDWIRFLNQWLDGKTQDDAYRRWLGLYPTLYQLHRYGDVYRNVLLRAADQQGGAFSLQLLLAPRANPVFSGAGEAFDAPPLGPALGIGAPWVLRELARLRVISSPIHVARHCYVPRQKTRDLLMLLGASGMEPNTSDDHGERSKRMFDFVAEHLGEVGATFGGAFDLPLYIYATEGTAREECAS